MTRLDLTALVTRLRAGARPESTLLAEERAERSAQARAILARIDQEWRRAAHRVQVPVLLESASAWRWGGPGLVLSGGTGIGKTSAALAALATLLAAAARTGGAEWELARRVAWLDARSLGQARLHHGLGRGEAPEVRTATSASLLVLDDLGWEASVDTVRDVLAERSRRRLPTWATTGLGMAELFARYGDATVRRLLEVSGQAGRIVEVLR